MQAAPATTSTTPTPPYRNEGSQPLPQTPFPLQGRGLTAPPVALSLRYPRPIKGSGWFLNCRATISAFLELGDDPFLSEPLFKGRQQRGCRNSWRTPKGQRPESHTKTLTEGGFPPESVKSLANDWREI